MTHPVLIAGQWQPSQSSETFQAHNPASGEQLPDEYPVSNWQDCEAALAAAAACQRELAKVPREDIARFLERYAELVDAEKQTICEVAQQETGLPFEPRLAGVELPRTTNQLRLGAQAARDASWRQITIDSKTNIRSWLAPLGPVMIFGPNNFPLAFNAISGGDFTAAIAAGNPVIAKGHPLHPTTTRLLAEQAHQAVTEIGLPSGMVQLLYHMKNEDGVKLVSDARIGATAFTGSRNGGLALKAVADAAGKPIFLEMSSINPVVILPGALAERSEKIAQEYTTSCLMGTGQFCTNPGLVLLCDGPQVGGFIENVVQKFMNAPVGTLFSAKEKEGLHQTVETWEQAGAELLTGGDPVEGNRYSNTLLKIRGQQFLAHPETFQTEAFGNAGLFVVAADVDELEKILETIEGNLTGCFYSHTQGEDEALYQQLEPVMRRRVGRLLNDKMPTGVAVSSAMNHGGPYPATGSPRFTAVGIPAALERFTMLQCYDNVRPERLPAELQNNNPQPNLWRFVDGTWSQGDIE